MTRVATASASRRDVIGVDPAWDSVPRTVQSYQRKPSAASTTPITFACLFEHRSLLDVRLEVAADRMTPGRLVAEIADARELVADRSPFHVARSVGVVEIESAAEHAGAHHHRHEARAFLVGPRGDFERRLGHDAVIGERADHLEPREHAVVAVELAAGGLRVDVRAGHHRRKFRPPAVAAHEDVADAVDGDRHARLARAGDEPVTPLAVEIGERKPGHAAFGRGADLRQIHQRTPQPLPVDAQC
jgi:hypothetical protein